MLYPVQAQATEHRFSRTVAALAVAHVLAAFATSATAQNAGTPSQASDGTVLERVIVTADRREESVQEVNTAITVIGGAAVEEKEIRNAGDIIRFVPNMTADTTDGHGRPKWYIRGIGLSDASLHMTNPIGTYVDDVYVWNASTVGFPLFDLDRVEVLRGPQGTLWGKNTTGGAINFISKKPVFKDEGYLKASYADYNETLLEGAVNKVLKEDVLAARVSFFRQDAERYAKNNFRDGADRYGETAVRAQLQANFSDSFDGLLNVHHRRFKGPVLTTFNGSNRLNERFEAPSVVKPEDVLEQNGGSVTLNKQFGSYTLTSITSADNFGRGATGGDLVPWESARSWSDFSVRQLSQEIRLASPKEDKVSWILGGYYFNGRLKSDTANAVLPGSVTATGAAKTRAYNRGSYTLDSDSIAIFGNLNVKVTDKFELATGVRQTHESKDIDLTYGRAAAGFTFNDPSVGGWYRAGVSTPLTTLASQNASRSWDEFTWDITPSYQFTDNLRTYARVAKGFNGGNFNAGAVAQTEVGSIDPEYITSYEIGLKSEWLDHRLQVNGSIFYYDYTEMQQKAERVDAATNTIIKTFLNAASGVSKGIEIEVLARPLRNLTLGLNLGYQHTEFTDFQINATTNIAGNWFNRVPRVVSNVFAEYKVPLASGASINLATDWAYRSKSYFNAEDQTSEALIEKGYTLGNVSAGYTTANGKHQFRLYANNVTDQKYRNTSLINGSFSYGAPRVVGISATTKF